LGPDGIVGKGIGRPKRGINGSVTEVDHRFKGRSGGNKRLETEMLENALTEGGE